MFNILVFSLLAIFCSTIRAENEQKPMDSYELKVLEQNKDGCIIFSSFESVDKVSGETNYADQNTCNVKIDPAILNFADSIAKKSDINKLMSSHTKESRALNLRLEDLNSKVDAIFKGVRLCVHASAYWAVIAVGSYCTYKIYLKLNSLFR